jgi:dUTP pyrophosphatase
MQVKIKKLHVDAVIPAYSKPGDAGMDLTAVTATQDQYGNVVYGTGLAFEIPEGYVMMVYSRSGHGFKNGIQ